MKYSDKGISVWSEEQEYILPPLDLLCLVCTTKFCRLKLPFVTTGLHAYSPQIESVGETQITQVHNQYTSAGKIPEWTLLPILVKTVH